MKKLISLVLLFSLTSLYGANRIKTWSSEILTSSDLNTEFNNIFIGDISRSAGYWGTNDDIPIFVGTSQDTRIEWDTTQSTDSTLIGLGAGLILSVMELADMSTDWGIASQSNPTLYVHSADASATTDFISITHDQTNAVISNGIGSINLVVEGATADGYETTVTFTDPTADQTVTIANATGTVMLTSLAANGADLVNAVTGGSNSLIWEGTADGYETTLTATDPTADRTITIPNVTGTILTTGAAVTVAQGGSGATSLTDGGVLLGSATGAITATSVLADGEILIGDGSTDPVALDVGSSTSITVLGTIATGTWQATDVGVGYGGTGASSFTDGGVLLGSGSGALTATAVLGDGVILIGDASGDPATLDVGSSTSITILGTIATGTWEATDVGVAHGGTGASTLTNGGVLLGSGTGAITPTAVLADGEILIGDGTTDPVALDVGSSSSITVLGTVATGTWEATDVGAAHGGTGVSSLTDGGILLGSGAGAITALGVAANGEIPIGDGSTDPQLATITGTANEVTVTNGGGSITLSIPDASIFVTPRATGASEFNGTVLSGANGTSLDGRVHMLNGATDEVGLVSEVIASTSVNNQIWQYNGTDAAWIMTAAGSTQIVLGGRDLGNDVRGPTVRIERNTNSSNPGAGHVRMTDKGGTEYYVHPDDSGVLRIGTTSPVGSADTSNTIVGTQTSFLYHPDGTLNKTFIRDIEPSEGLGVILGTGFTVGEYADGLKGEQVWPYAEKAPWLMQDPRFDLPGGRSHSPVSHASLNSLAIQALNQKIEDLENEINRLHSNRSGDVALNR